MKGPVKLSQFLFLADVLAKSIGLTPYEDETKSGKFRKIKEWIFIVLIANLVIIFCGEIVFILVTFIHQEDFIDTAMNVSYVGITLTALIKMLSVLRKKQILTTLMIDIRKLFPNDAKLQQDFDLRRYMIRFNIISFGFVLLNEILVCLYNFYTVVNYLIYDYWLAVKIVPRKLPFNVWLPWQWQDHWSYYILYFLQNLAGHTCMSGLLASDMIMCAVAAQIIMHYSYLARRIETYQPTYIYAKDERFLKDAIQYHQKIISLTSCMNEVFGGSLLVNYFSSSFTICFLGFLMTTDVNIDRLVMIFLFLFCSLLQILMLAYYGQQLIVKSEHIGHAVYNQNWFKTDRRYRKMLAIVIQRAQRPTLMRATTFLHISFATVTDLIQLSYKLSALLKTLYSN